MNILFVTMAWPKVGEYNLYTDLMQEFVCRGHRVFVACALESSVSGDTIITEENGIKVFRIPTGHMQKVNKYKKVISSFLAGPRIANKVKKECKNQRIDWILFTTPPITMTPSIVSLKKFFKAKLYLLLKDIWPQDTVDLGAMKKGGIVWSVFRMLEVLTYKNADYIGCMSPAGKQYVLEHNSFLRSDIVEVCPNSQRPREIEIDNFEEVKRKYQLPQDKTIYLYGGNLGEAQGVEFLVDIASEMRENKDFYLLVIGSGTKYQFLEESFARLNLDNVKLLPAVSKEEYDTLVAACDVGVILLHPDATVPNFPSRLLSYINVGIPVVAAVDKATDIGHIIEENDCGYTCLNGDVNRFAEIVEQLSCREVRKEKGQNAKKMFMDYYTCEKGYRVIEKHFVGE